MFVEIVLFIIIVSIFVWKHEQKPHGLPPGEWGLPIIGYFPPIKVRFIDHLKDLQKKHGNVFCVRFGRTINVFLSNFNDAKTIYSSLEAINRPNWYTFRIINAQENLGLSLSNGQIWENNRRFTLKHMKTFGLGKSYFQNVIAGEAKFLVENLTEYVDKPYEVKGLFHLSVVNVIWQLVASKRYERNDERILIFEDQMMAANKTLQGPLFLLDIYPVFRNIVPKLIKDSIMKEYVIENMAKHFEKLIKENIEYHEKSIDTENPRNFIDALLIDKAERKNLSDFNQEAETKNMYSVLVDLFTAGSETVSTSLKWFVIYMATNPKIQEKLHKEIDNVLSDGRIPTLEDKKDLHYLEATIHELLRKVSLTPINLPHALSEDTKIGSYLIPRGTSVYAFNEIIHNDPEYYENPNEFYPEHFLNENGEFISKKEGFLPFSIGKRQCLGEPLARMELFIFTAFILQHFRIIEPTGAKQTVAVDKEIYVLNYPTTFQVVFTKR